MNPVMYMNDEFTTSEGVHRPGWYFWDETWATCYGPYESEQEADEACVEYAKHL